MYMCICLCVYVYVFVCVCSHFNLWKYTLLKFSLINSTSLLTVSNKRMLNTKISFNECLDNVIEIIKTIKSFTTQL